MEEILASIRRIIAEDGDAGGAQPAAAAPAAAAAAPVAAPAPPPRASAPPSPPPTHDDVLELTDVVEEPKPPPPPKVVEQIFAVEEEDLPRSAPLPLRLPGDDDRLISNDAAAASVAALSQMFAKGRDLPLGNTARTLEDLVRELLRPLLKSWLDENLPALVERLVREEIGRLGREVSGR